MKRSEARLQDFISGRCEELPHGELNRLKRQIAAGCHYFWSRTSERMRKATPSDLAPICIPR